MKPLLSSLTPYQSTFFEPYYLESYFIMPLLKIFEISPFAFFIQFLVHWLLTVDFLRTLLFGELFLQIKGSFTVLSLRAGGQVHMDFWLLLLRKFFAPDNCWRKQGWFFFRLSFFWVGLEETPSLWFMVRGLNEQGLDRSNPWNARDFSHPVESGSSGIFLSVRPLDYRSVMLRFWLLCPKSDYRKALNEHLNLVCPPGMKTLIPGPCVFHSSSPFVAFAQPLLSRYWIPFENPLWNNPKGMNFRPSFWFLVKEWIELNWVQISEFKLS